jgi:hypothetical protein
MLKFLLYRLSNRWLAKLLPPPLHLLFIILYVAGTSVCNIFGVESLSGAGVRAAHLSLINLIPMYLSGGHEFGAFLLGVRLETYGTIHRTVGAMVVLQALIHVVIMVKTKAITASEGSHFYEILVCLRLSIRASN